MDRTVKRSGIVVSRVETLPCHYQYSWGSSQQLRLEIRDGTCLYSKHTRHEQFFIGGEEGRLAQALRLFLGSPPLFSLSLSLVLQQLRYPPPSPPKLGGHFLSKNPKEDN